MSSHRRLFALLLLTVLLAACAVFSPGEKRRRSDLDDFMYALRWQRFPEAASYMEGHHRQAFLAQVEGLKDLNITDVRLQRFEVKEDGRLVETRLEMDYYLLPSATLKTLRIDQTWRYFEAVDADSSGFLIATPFPEIPQAAKPGGR